MTIPTLFLAVLLSLLPHAASAQTLCAREPVDERAPAELARFVEPGSCLLRFYPADLDGDGTRDYLVVLQRGDDMGSRVLLVVGRGSNGALALLKKNGAVVGCQDCGGVMGDPFQELEVKGRRFTVSNAGGSRDRWSSSYTFAYSRRDKTWQLVRVEIDSFDVHAPDTSRESQVHVPPKDFGKIDFADFDPDNYLKKR
ncbi:hypothetical protein [Massilia sp. Leaf139]|uniref:hypothetical protein n=1 Tax=Massilia sp. Leaf139 TaxID=1736272 RepID=UPI0006FAEAAB|nr:hypothetical protein [Massilia sp. Leaf139]KQQ87881.1 hypothetical protein ASF77_14200 [Massilia sp. Leaf139]